MWPILWANRRTLGLFASATIGVVWLLCGWAIQDPVPMILGAAFTMPPLVVAYPRMVRRLDHWLRRYRRRAAPAPATPAAAPEEEAAEPRRRTR
jgi:hypothetical protein